MNWAILPAWPIPRHHDAAQTLPPGTVLLLQERMHSVHILPTGSARPGRAMPGTAVRVQESRIKSYRGRRATWG
jgi:hypothetical protein